MRITMSFSKALQTFAVHCPNCRCPALGTNGRNRLCKAAAKKKSKWWKEPPCEWCHAAPTVVEQATYAMQTNVENWGQYLKDSDSWPVDVPEHLKLGARVHAPFQTPGGKQEMRLAKVIGRYSNEEAHFTLIS